MTGLPFKAEPRGVKTNILLSVVGHMTVKGERPQVQFSSPTIFPICILLAFFAVGCVGTCQSDQPNLAANGRENPCSSLIISLDIFGTLLFIE
jgi:hypothetical protein